MRVSMASDTISCIKEITKNIHITLSISYLANEVTGISDVLESWKRQYIQILQGIVVSYKNVLLLSKYAYIQSDNPVIQCNVQATFELFTPSIGCIVKGVVNRISYDYIGCLVHNTINVAINRFDNVNDASNFIALDKEILFEITHLGYKRKVIKVKGKITQECVNLMKQLNFSAVESSFATNNRVIYSSNESSDNSNDECINTGSHILYNDATVVGKTSDYSSDLDLTSPKKKSKKSRKDRNTSAESLTENCDESQSLLNNNSRLTAEDLSEPFTRHDSSKKKKKKSRKKDRADLSIDDSSETSSNQINADHSILFNEDISPKKKKLKKSTSNIIDKNLFLNISEPQNLDDNSSETSNQSSSSKKKKHKKSYKDVLSSPSIFSDSLSSKDEIKPFKVPITPPKKKKEKSPVKFSPSKAVNSVKGLVSLDETYKDTPSDLFTSTSPLKLKHEFSLHVDNLTVGSSLHNQSTEMNFSLNDSVLNKEKSPVSAKKAKKRKRESSGKDGLPKKKKKLDSDISKHKGDKSKKKSKNKSKKDSKKDKKRKSKNKVISTKKKLPKLKKKKKENTEKLKSKSKKSKHKKDVP